MAYKYRMLAGAQRDYENILNYLCSVADGLSAAKSFADEFDHQIGLVCENPYLYSLSRMPEVAALGYRVMLVNNYLALYFFRKETVFVAHIFHQMQDYGRIVLS